jgi:hypothetical protein
VNNKLKRTVCDKLTYLKFLHLSHCVCRILGWLPLGVWALPSIMLGLATSEIVAFFLVLLKRSDILLFELLLGLLFV